MLSVAILRTASCGAFDSILQAVREKWTIHRIEWRTSMVRCIYIRTRYTYTWCADRIRTSLSENFLGKSHAEISEKLLLSESRESLKNIHHLYIEPFLRRTVFLLKNFLKRTERRALEFVQWTKAWRPVKNRYYRSGEWHPRRNVFREIFKEKHFKNATHRAFGESYILVHWTVSNLNFKNSKSWKL